MTHPTIPHAVVAGRIRKGDIASEISTLAINKVSIVWMTIIKSRIVQRAVGFERAILNSKGPLIFSSRQSESSLARLACGRDKNKASAFVVSERVQVWTFNALTFTCIMYIAKNIKSMRGYDCKMLVFHIHMGYLSTSHHSTPRLTHPAIPAYTLSLVIPRAWSVHEKQ